MSLTPNQTPPGPERQPAWLAYFGYIMVVIYLGLGLVLLLSNLVAAELPLMQRQLLGGLLTLYGIYRAFSIYKRIRSEK